MRPTVAIIGTGNVAWHLAKNLGRVADVTCIVGTDKAKAQALVEDLGLECAVTANVSDIAADVDFCFLAVRDDEIQQVASKIPAGPIVVHTSGTSPLSVLGNHNKRGVMWPLQTLTKGVPVDFSQVRVYIEGSTIEVEESLRKIASLVSEKVRKATSEQRAKMHLAATVACNFTNYVLGMAYEIAHAENLEFNELQGLVEATVNKAFNGVDPQLNQTGPAARNDVETMQRHLSRLDGDNKDVYKFLSEKIARKRR